MLDILQTASSTVSRRCPDAAIREQGNENEILKLEAGCNSTLGSWLDDLDSEHWTNKIVESSVLCLLAAEVTSDYGSPGQPLAQ